MCQNGIPNGKRDDPISRSLPSSQLEFSSSLVRLWRFMQSPKIGALSSFFQFRSGVKGGILDFSPTPNPSKHEIKAFLEALYIKFHQNYSHPKP